MSDLLSSIVAECSAETAADKKHPIPHNILQVAATIRHEGYAEGYTDGVRLGAELAIKRLRESANVAKAIASDLREFEAAAIDPPWDLIARAASALEGVSENA